MQRSELWTEVKGELTRLGYTLEDELTSGSNSSNAKVWKARYANGGVEETRAVKVTSSLMFESWEGLGAPGDDEEILGREREIYQRLTDHPNIPGYRDFQHFLVREVLPVDMLATEFVESPNLNQWITSRRKIHEGQAIQVLENILAALDHVHGGISVEEGDRQQVLHRDVKPGNVLFNGEVAHLFDFNFSKIGEATSASRIVDNGYYPVDAYGGIPTQSHDLVAVGNVVACAGYGLEITELRSRQSVQGLDAISMDGLPFSPKLKRFLRKLTSSNPALRYQTAEQALDDLRTLDTLTEEVLDQRLMTITRSKGLTRMLERLEQEDDLFEYNVPQSLRDSYDDDALLGHLEKVYSKEEFYVDNPRLVEEFVRAGDRVLKKGAEKKVKWSVERGTQGYTRNVSEDKVKVSFWMGPTVAMDPIDLQVVGREHWLRDQRFEKPQPATEYPNLHSGLWVEYMGETMEEVTHYLPDKAVGVVHQDDKDDAPLRISWERRPDLVGVHTDKTHTRRWFNYDSVILVRKNHIDFQKLYKECFGANERQELVLETTP